MKPSARWSRALALHRSASAAFADAAKAVAPGAWHLPRAEGKWSPAQITDHLIQTYDVLLRELQGGSGMRVRTRFLQRMFLRLTLMPRLMRGARFPERVPAPPEIRPTGAPGQQDGIALFRRRAAELEATAQQVLAQVPRARLTHAYFGPSSVANGVLFCARHIEHHRAQI
jgi:DinB superfamily